MTMTATELRFAILKNARYDKAAAEIMVDFIADDETRYNLFNLAFNSIVDTGANPERASAAVEAAEIMVVFTGVKDADRYQLYTECFNRVTATSDVKSRAKAAADEAGKLITIISGK